MQTKYILSTILILYLGVLMFACKKDRLTANPHHIDTLIVVSEVDTCSGVASLPINCYTTPFIRGYRSIVESDTFILKEEQCIWFGNCSNRKFTAIYKVCVEGITDFRIPDTVMCRRDSLNLCCVDFYDYYSTCSKYTPAPGDFWDDVFGPDKPVDVASVYFSGVSYCYVRHGFYYESILAGPTKYFSEPIDSMGYDFCPYYFMLATPDSVRCRNFKVGPCNIHIVDVFPRPDSVQSVNYLYQESRPPCCTGAYSSLLKDSVKSAKIVVSCEFKP